LRQECAATIGRLTRRFVPALRKGGLRKGPRRKTAPTSEKGEDTQRGHQAEPKTGDNEIDSRVFHRDTRTGGRGIVEV
jgi:hypothetical protein